MNEKTAEKTSLQIKRFIKMSPDRVYAAWTDPTQLKEWWGPEGVITRSLTADVRVGGKYRWDMTSPEGEEMSALGEYRWLVPGKKVVVSVEAYSAGGGSPETRGKEGVRGKIDWWVNAMEVHRFDAEQPFVGHDRFVVQFDAEVSDKKSKERRKLSEVGVYTVKNGKIV